MRFVKRIILFVLVCGILLLIGLAVGKNAIFERVLNGALADVRKDRNVQVSYDSASLGLFGGVSFEKVKAVDIATETVIVEGLNLDVDFGWFGLMGSPLTIDRLSAEGARVTLVSGIGAPSEAPEEAEPVPTAEGEAPAEEALPGVLLKQLEIADTVLLLPQDGTPEAVARLEAKATNLSLTESFEFDVTLTGEGAGKGTAQFKGKVDPTTYDTDIQLAIRDLTFPMGAELFPTTRGEATLVLKDSFSQIASKGRLETSSAPPGLPPEILAGTPFALDWNIASEMAGGGAGKVDLRDFRIQVEGLKGGTQALTGNGAYDPSTAQGEFRVQGKGLSAPLLNAGIGPESGMRIESGSIGIDLLLSRAGADAPFVAKGNVSATGLNLKDTTGGGNNLEFKSVSLDLDANYAPDTDLLNLAKLAIAVDDIPLSVSGRISGLMDEAARELDLQIAGADLDVGRLAALAGGALAGVGTVSGKADVDLALSGKTASDTFPILDGSLNAKGLTFVPADSPDMKVSVTGIVNYDSTSIAGEGLTLNLADVPGKLSFRVVGYNAPQKAITATVEEVGIAPVLRLVSPDSPGYLTGNLNGSVQTTLVSGQPPQEVAVNFNIKECRILTGDNPIPKSAADSLGWKWLEGNYPLSEASGKVSQAGAGYRIENLRLVGKEGGIAFSGDIDPNGITFAGILKLLEKGQPTESEVSLNGKFDPETQAGTVEVGLKSFSYPTPEGPSPKANGKLTAQVSENLSAVSTQGQIALAQPPKTIPKELSAGTPFELGWNFNGKFPQGAPIQVDTLDLTIKGLQGGPQTLTGSGSYDTKTANGQFKANGKGLSLPLVNPFLEPPSGMRVLSGKGDLSLDASRSGEKNPFNVKGDLELASLSVKDLSGKKPNMSFSSIGLNFDSSYAQQADRLDIKSLSLRLEDIPLSVLGKIEALQDSAKRNLNLAIKGQGLDVGRLMALTSPQTAKGATVTGKADIDVNVSGRPSSEKFPVLVGSVNTPGLTYVPAEGPDQKIGMRGVIKFDSDTLTADSMDITVAETLGKLTLKVRGYNEPIKKVDADLRGVDIDPVLKIYKPSAAGIVTGKLNAVIDTLIGQGSRPEQLDIQFTIDDGVLLTKHPLPSAIVEVVGWDWMRNGIVMNNAKGHVVQDERGYRLDNLFLMGEKGGLSARGWVGFDNKLDVEMRVNVAKANATELNSVLQKVLRANPDSPWAYLGFDIKGTLQRPLPVPQYDALIGAGLDQVRERFGTELQEKYGDQIRERTGIDTNEALDGAGGLIRGIFDRGGD
jgi:hypothetical protein